jgi:demethylmenaquinone methyltransferase/2-methoxy-6-polyprenyl-1,4-benzoquinol methylase
MSQPTASSQSWRDDELTNPHASAQKATKVQGMFEAIAGSYDLNNRLHSLWQDVRWRNFAVRHAGVKQGDVVLDVACGTGDLTHAFATKSPASKVIGLDFTPGMLDRARVKLKALSPKFHEQVTYMQGDAQNLPQETASIDVLSIAFGIRNVTDPSRALAEFARVLRQSGRIVILEFETPKNPLVRAFNDFYCAQVMPRTATWISRDKSGAYKYLPKSVATFASREKMLEMLAAAGFKNATATPLSLGICMCYRAEKA